MTDTALSVNQIERAILDMHGGELRVLAVPNVYWGMLLGYEADLIVVSRKGYATEYEIKRSWQDFRNDMKKRKHAHYAEIIYNFAYVVPEKIADKVREYLEQSHTEYDLPCVYAYNEQGKLGKVCGKLHPRKRDVEGCCRKLTDGERYDLARLGVIKYWKHRKEVINERLRKTTHSGKGDEGKSKGIFQVS